jgi:PAS domain S-box-containing protein
LSRSSEITPLEKVIGLGERSVRKTYFPELQRRMQQLERFRALLDATRDLIMVASCNGSKIIDVNAAASEQLGYSVDELLEHVPIDALFRGPGLASILEFICGTGNDRVRLTTTMRRKDGTDFPAEITLTRVRHLSEWLVALLGYDITDRLAAEEARLREEVLRRLNEQLERRVDERTQEVEAGRRMLQRVVEAAPVPIAYLDPKQRYIFANEPYANRLEMPKEQLPGMSIAEALGKEAYGAIEAYLRKAYEGKMQVFEIERRMPRTGERRFYRIGYAPDIDEEGKISGIVIAMNDITDLKVGEEKLFAAKEAAEAGNRAKTEFLATMSHEMRTPLAAVLGMTELVLDMKIGGEERQLLETARRSGDDLLRMIIDLLDFSSLRDGTLPFRLSETDVAKCVAAAVDTVASQARESGLELTLRVDEAVPDAVMADAARLRQVLEKLLSNALKFTKEGRIEVAVSRVTEAEGREFVLFSVKDTGIGMTAETRNRIFEKFMQSDTSSRREYGGTGLGLALSKVIVERMGGRIWAESTFGRGSELFFTIPLVEPEKT